MKPPRKPELARSQKIEQFKSFYLDFSTLTGVQKVFAKPLHFLVHRLHGLSSGILFVWQTGLYNLTLYGTCVRDLTDVSKICSFPVLRLTVFEGSDQSLVHFVTVHVHSVNVHALYVHQVSVFGHHVLHDVHMRRVGVDDPTDTFPMRSQFMSAFCGRTNQHEITGT